VIVHFVQPYAVCSFTIFVFVVYHLLYTFVKCFSRYFLVFDVSRSIIGGCVPREVYC